MITVVVLLIAAVVSGIYVNWRTGGTAGRGARPSARRVAHVEAREDRPDRWRRIPGRARSLGPVAA